MDVTVSDKPVLTYLSIPDGRLILLINRLDDSVELNIVANPQLVHRLHLKQARVVRLVRCVNRLKVPDLLTGSH